jgi:hypothetical protein
LVRDEIKRRAASLQTDAGGGWLFGTKEADGNPLKGSHCFEEGQLREAVAELRNEGLAVAERKILGIGLDEGGE